MGLAAIVGVLATFKLKDIEISLLIIVDTAISLIAARAVYFGVSRFLLPSWAVERLSYEHTSASIDGRQAVVSTASHLAQDQWIRSFSVFVIVFWSVAWLTVVGGSAYLAATHCPSRSAAEQSSPPAPSAPRPRRWPRT